MRDVIYDEKGKAAADSRMAFENKDKDNEANFSKEENDDDDSYRYADDIFDDKHLEKFFVKRFV